MTITIPPTAPTPLPAARGTVFIPFVTAGRTPTAACFDSPPAFDFYHRLTTHVRQQRPTLICCPSLVAAARKRAAGLAAGGPWSHVDAAGVTPNEYATAAGCVLPPDYPQHGNNIESLVAGSPDAGACLEALAGSPKHAAHLFGEGDFFRAQTQIGIAMAEGSRFGWYWVILIGACL